MPHFKFFMNFYQNVPLRCCARILKQYLNTDTCKRIMLPGLIQARTYAEKGKDTKGGKGGPPINTVKMPGIIHPEALNEEGYFAQKAKQQLKELKNKPDLGKGLTDSEKKT